jgi:lysophospholipase L1-like esterase
MNGRQRRGWGMNAQDRTKTTTKNAANSIVGKLTALILAIATAAAVAAGPANAQGGGAVLVIGDSLTVGSAPYLRGALGSVSLEIDAQKSRPSSAGLAVLAEKLRPEHGTVVFDLGTNDLSANTLASSLASARQLVGDRCMVVSTIARPPIRGVSASALNQVVEQFASQGPVQVADWRAAVAVTPGALGSDHVHATGRGYALRASLLAEAIQGCQLGKTTGIPAPRNPHARPPDRPEPEREPEPPPKPRPPRETEVDLPGPPASLVAIASAAERMLALVEAAASDARQAAGIGPPEPVLGAR